MRQRLAAEATIEHVLGWLQATLDETGDIECLFELEGFTSFRYDGANLLDEGPKALTLQVLPDKDGEDRLTIYNLIQDLRCVLGASHGKYTDTTPQTLVRVMGTPTGGDGEISYTPLWHPYENVFKIVPTTASQIRTHITILDDHEIQDKKALHAISLMAPHEIAALKRALKELK